MFASTVGDPAWTFRVVYVFKNGLASLHQRHFILLPALRLCLVFSVSVQFLSRLSFFAIMGQGIIYWLIWWLPTVKHKGTQTIFTASDLRRSVKANELREGNVCTYTYQDGKATKNLKMKLLKKSSKSSGNESFIIPVLFGHDHLLSCVLCVPIRPVSTLARSFTMSTIAASFSFSHGIQP